ncbi:TIGR01457 family HAD-type hydrolase [Pseudobacillus badius]|uniref:TIGR01457 family HAD-type hydrolase n=1 Tax=Bacillus badius TaxID=1455 RepID=UPI0007B07D7E|nr:TIGR01457 family HAD-type hydrolase [Bacillus badius]KZN99514.1 HAD family hydrolase [Bacillus badius]OCS85351.1 HAD family hydrolase [Bacillus badius]OVE50402.1 HAD family hydrolase [Bacillus badius]TDW01303.1 4-nitrophenyl phosphatase [Bacillus badius]UAT30052.1 TIGR01457 family HAD-type hydrolase [Bacillus badius]
MKTYTGYLIDLDGTMYRGTEEIKEARSFINRLQQKNIPYLFVTNNSSRTPEQVAEKLRGFDIAAGAEQVFTTSMATANYIWEKHQQAAVYMIGEEGLHRALDERSLTLVEHERADVVVCGIDRQINYEKLATACLAVRSGADFISTNGDVAIPTERGLLPGNGALTSVIAVSTGVKPVFIGKPESIIMEQALKVLGTAKEATLMVGDNYQTDILAGIRSGLDTLLVHTGVTQKEHLVHVEQQPVHIRNNLDEWEV